jgi:hypothetical protein
MPIVTAGSCNVYSCAIHSVVAACGEQDNLKKHWKCLFTLLTNEDVLNCLEKTGLSLGKNSNVDWAVVMPKVLECVDAPVREKCGDGTVNLLNTLSVPLVGTSDNGACLVDANFLNKFGPPVEEGPASVAPTPVPEPVATQPVVEATIPQPAEITTKPPDTPKTTPAKKPVPVTFAQVDETTTKGTSSRLRASAGALTAAVVGALASLLVFWSGL